ncbi:MAG: S26 family signal peptidase [Algisphaera sp.]
MNPTPHDLHSESTSESIPEPTSEPIPKQSSAAAASRPAGGPFTGPDRRKPGSSSAVRRSSRRSTDESIKETIESVVIAFILTFIFRAFVMEAFVIPTGSMAPTLLGQHVEARCSQCGYTFTFDESGTARLRRGATASCPMCFFHIDSPAGTATRSGDRLLVQKYLYHVTEPRRWDVVVFRNPQAVNHENQSPGPTTNYIKRLVGLPNEDLTLFEGNIHVRPHRKESDAPGQWRIARKTDPAANPRWEKIQRALWQPIYHSKYRPLDGGIEHQGDRRHRYTAWRDPWIPSGSRWRVAGDKPGHRLQTDVKLPASLTFDWSLYRDSGVYHPYNTTISNGGVVRGQAIEDIRLATTLDAQMAGVSLALTTSARLGVDPRAPLASLTATLRGDGRVVLTQGIADASKDSPAPTLLAQAEAPVTGPHRAVRMELWFVDAEALVFIDGDLALRHAFDDLTLDQIKHRPPPPARPTLKITLAGGPATLHDIQLDRDLYHTSQIQSSGDRAPLGALYRDFRGQLVETPPLNLTADRFYVLGDNGPISNDARFWSSIEPWLESREHPQGPDVAEQTQAGIPDYVHHVPRSMLVGRAFFVYWPAPYPFARDGRQVIPNFGSMRFIY